MAKIMKHRHGSKDPKKVARNNKQKERNNNG